MATNVTLQGIYDAATSGMDVANTTLLSTLDSLSTGSNMSVQDMVKLQYHMSVFTIVSQTGASIMKEMTDTMKSVLQKF